jgi:hypothetical protein
VFSLTPPTSADTPWTYAVVCNFTGGSDGGGPGGLTIGPGGVLFGTTGSGGTGYGTAFALTPPASAGDSWSIAVLYSFTGGSSGTGPSALTLAKNGALYGTMKEGGSTACSDIYLSGCGTVFGLTPPASPSGSWVFNTLYSFTGGNDGWAPYAGVVIGKTGDLIGTAYLGGAFVYYGTIFALTPPESSGAHGPKRPFIALPATPTAAILSRASCLGRMARCTVQSKTTRAARMSRATGFMS